MGCIQSGLSVHRGGWPRLTMHRRRLFPGVDLHGKPDSALLWARYDHPVACRKGLSRRDFPDLSPLWHLLLKLTDDLPDQFHA